MGFEPTTFRFACSPKRYDHYGTETGLLTSFFFSWCFTSTETIRLIRDGIVYDINTHPTVLLEVRLSAPEELGPVFGEVFHESARFPGLLAQLQARVVHPPVAGVTPG